MSPTLFDAALPDPGAIPGNLTDGQAASIAAEIVEYLRATYPESVVKEIPAAVLAIASPTRLREILEWWNALNKRGLVPHGVRVEKPAAEILAAWSAFKKNATAQECLADLKKLESEIEKSALCRNGWFRLEKLLRGANNGAGVPIVRVLKDGGYRDERTGAGKNRGGVGVAGQGSFDSAADKPFDDWYREQTGAAG